MLQLCFKVFRIYKSYLYGRVTIAHMQREELPEKEAYGEKKGCKLILLTFRYEA